MIKSWIMKKMMAPFDVCVGPDIQYNEYMNIFSWYIWPGIHPFITVCLGNRSNAADHTYLGRQEEVCYEEWADCCFAPVTDDG